VAVTIGGQPATVLYAGWVQDSIAGLYQVNAQLPSLTPTTANSSKFTTVAGANVSAIADNVQLPVKVTMNGQTSQDGVSIWVAPRLKVTAPATLSGTVGTQWATTNNALTTSGGTAPYRYAVTSGLLPSGLSLSSTLGAITGYPAANTNGQYLITVTATDSSQIPVTGSATFTLMIGSGLMLSSTAILPSYPFGVAAAITTVSATGGVWPYKYTTTALAGLTVNVDTGAVAIDATLRAGTYTVTVLATDSATPPVTGSITFDIVVGLVLTPGSITSPTSVTGGAITTFTTTGNTGVVTYAVDTTNAGLGFQMTGAVLSLGASNTAAAGTYAVIVTATDPTQATGASVAGTGKYTVNVTVGAAAQTISFTAPSATATFSQLIAPITLVGSSSSTLPITYTVSGPATVSGSTLTITGAGIVSVTASQAGNAFHAAATPVTYTITVAKGTQTITFAATASGAINSSMTLAATSDSGLAVSYTYAAGTGSATLSGSTLTLTGQGTFTITASQPGNANYNAATPVVQTITVTP
jgi:hypothetical protein